MEPNPQFSIDKVLRPCKVTRSLLSDLERTVVSTLDEVARGGSDVKRSVALVISDDRGNEKFHSADALVGSLFHDSVSEIVLEVIMRVSGGDASAALLATVRLRFSQKARPSLQIIMQCPRAREQAIGLEERIVRVMDPSVEDARIFQASEDTLGGLLWLWVLGMIIWTPSVGGALAERNYSELTGDKFLFWTLFLALVGSYILVCRRYFPPTTFDTRRRTLLDEQKNWARKTVWSLVGVNVLAVTIGGMVIERIRSLLGMSP